MNPGIVDCQQLGPSTREVLQTLEHGKLGLGIPRELHDWGNGGNCLRIAIRRNHWLACSGTGALYRWLSCWPRLLECELRSMVLLTTTSYSGNRLRSAVRWDNWASSFARG